MALRFWLIGLLALTAAGAQLSGYYVKQEAAELRALVRQVAADSERLEALRTDEMFRRRPAQVEEWAKAFEELGPPQLSQVQPSLKQALMPAPLPRPVPIKEKPLPDAPQSDDMIATLIAQSELAL